MRLRSAASALLLVIGLGTVLPGCGDGEEPSTTDLSQPPAAGFSLETHGDKATALLQSPEIARQLCDSIEAGGLAEQLRGVKEVRLSAYESGKPVTCKVP